MDKFHKYKVEQHNPGTKKKYMLYDFTYVKLKIRQNELMIKARISGFSISL